MLTAKNAVKQRNAEYIKEGMRKLLPLSNDDHIRSRPVLSTCGWEHKPFHIKDASGRLIGEINYSTSENIGIEDLALAEAMADRVVLAVNSFDALAEFFQATQLMHAAEVAEFADVAARYKTATKAVMLALAGKQVEIEVDRLARLQAVAQMAMGAK